MKTKTAKRKKRRKNGVTKRTYDRNVKRFAKKCSMAWNGFERFVRNNCKDPEKIEKFSDEMSKVVDSFINANCEIYAWCNSRGVDVGDFICDVDNTNFACM